MMRFLGGLVGIILWAIQLIGRLIRALFFAILFGAVLGGLIWFGSDLFGNWLGFAKNGVAHLILHAFAGIMGVSSAWAILRDKLRDSANPILTSHGSARFASPAERTLLTAHQGGLLIGRDLRSAKLLRYDGPGHLLTIAPTRTGKGVGTVIPNLLMADRSVICVDPKGENTAITARARSRLGPVHVLDPFGITGQPSACFNPLAALDPASVDLAEDAATLAEALVFDAPGEAGEAHWNEEAKALIGGLILYLVCHESVPGRTLANLRGLLTMSPPDFANLLTMMQGSIGAGGLVARAANRHLGKADREATGVLSAAQRHTHFLDSPRMTAALDHSDFDFGDLKRRIATVFFVLPPDRLATYARWLRLMVIQSLQDLARAPGQPVAPILYLLDEFAALGHLAPVERAMSLMAGYGVQLWPILQDLHQLRSTYGRNAGTFFSNASVLQVFGVNDSETAQLVSGLLGQTTIVFSTESRRDGTLFTSGDTSTSDHQTGRPLLTPDEVRNLPQHQELLFIAGQRPVLANKLRYYADREFEMLYRQG
jgi:type IV secretion system protein VirD4